MAATTERSTVEGSPVYPAGSRVNDRGHLVVGGCDVVDLAREFGTPLFIYDEQTLRDQCRAYRAAFGARTDLYEIVYASKAFSCRAIAELSRRRASRSTSPPAASSAGARAAGFPPERIYFHGNNKSPAEIESRLDAGIGHFVVDSFEEIERLEAAAAPRPPGRARARHAGRAPQHARLHPDRPAGQQVRLRAGRRARARGGPPRSGTRPTSSSSACTRTSARRSSSSTRTGARSRCSSSPSTMWRATSASSAASSTSAAASGIRYTADGRATARSPSTPPSARPARCSGEARHPDAQALRRAGPQHRRQGGRHRYTVGTVKVIPGVRTYVAVDGGMSDNLRPMLYDSHYEAMLANKAEATGRRTW